MAPNIVIAGLFDGASAARRGERTALDRGFHRRDVRVLPPRAVRPRPIWVGPLIGMVAGGVLGFLGGGLVGWLATQGSSPLGSVTTGAGLALPIGVFVLTGAAVGINAGALFGMATAGDPAMYVVQEVQRGRALVSVTAGTGDASRAEAALTAAGATDVLDLGHGEAAHRVTAETARARGRDEVGRPRLA